MILPGWVSKYTRLPFEDFDCWQLIRKIYKAEFGILLPSYNLSYKGPTDIANIQRLCNGEPRSLWKQLSFLEQLNVGDVLLFNINGMPCHIGLCVDPKKKLMIHTMKKIDVGIENYSQPMWVKRIAGCFTYDR